MTGATPRQQVVSTHVPPSPTLIPQAPPASAPKRVARPPQFGTSIKEIGVEHPKAQATTQAATVVQEMQSPFSQEAFGALLGCVCFRYRQEGLSEKYDDQLQAGLAG